MSAVQYTWLIICQWHKWFNGLHLKGTPSLMQSQLKEMVTAKLAVCVFKHLKSTYRFKTDACRGKAEAQTLEM